MMAGDAPSNRAPINVALVLDRSGSMSGMPLHATKDDYVRKLSRRPPQA